MGKVRGTNNNNNNNIDKPKSSKTNKKNSIESQVLAIVKNADKLLGVQAIRTSLVNRGRKDGVALKKRLKAVLEDLENQNRDDFSRTRASYYGGSGSKVGKDLKAREAEEKRKRELENWHQCAWCQGWIEKEDERLNEDGNWQEAFDARGCSFKCPLDGCGKTFWWSYACSPGETMRKYHKGGYHAFVGNT